LSIDTRIKIITLGQARQQASAMRAEGRAVRAVTAWCDPLLPEVAARITRCDAGEAWFVFLGTPEDAYLEPRARAELAASLAAVSAVIVVEGDPRAEAVLIEPEELLTLHTEEQLWRSAFIERVRRKSAVSR
jgi:hypothetical protein